MLFKLSYNLHTGRNLWDFLDLDMLKQVCSDYI